MKRSATTHGLCRMTDDLEAGGIVLPGDCGMKRVPRTTECGKLPSWSTVDGRRRLRETGAPGGSKDEHGDGDREDHHGAEEADA